MFKFFLTTNQINFIMQRFFTKHLFLLLFMGASVGMMGQNPYNNFRVNAPASVAGNYTVVAASFGSTPADPVTADCAEGAPFLACEALTNPDDVKDKIAFIGRGVCGFGTKALNAEKAGAIAIVICNNAPGGGAVGMATNPDGDQVTVPVVSMSLEDCNRLQVALRAGELNGTFQFICGSADEVPEFAFWGTEPGQSDFTDGLGGWIVGTDDEFLEERDLWFHSPEGRPLRRYTGSQIRSITGCTGAAVFDLENLQFQDNPTYAFPYNNFYQSTLTSPPVDCSNAEFVSIQFYMMESRLNNFSGQGRFAEVHLFDGENWVDTVRLNTVNNWGQTATQRVTIPASKLAGKSNCRVRFWKGGDFGFMAIDDVYFIDKKNVDVQVNNNWIASVPTWGVPGSQVSPIPFMADVENIGNAEANDVTLKLEIRDPQGELIETLELDYGTIDAAGIIENIPFPNQFTPPSEPGVYRGIYIISSPDEEGNRTNNTVDFQFEITENTFKKMPSEAEFGQAYLAGFPNNFVVDVPSFYSVGNVYYVEKGSNFKATTVNVGIANPVAEVDNEGFIKVDLFELKSRDGLASSSERVHIGTGEIFLTTDELTSFRNIEVKLSVPDLEGGYDPESTAEITLKDKTHYLVAAHAEPFQASTPRFQFLGTRAGINTAFLRGLFDGVTNFAWGELGIPRYSGSFADRSTGVSDEVRERLNRSISQGIQGSGNQRVNSYLPLTIAQSTSTYDLASVGEAKLFPNPAAREFYVDVTLDKVSSNVRIDLITIDGKLASSRNYSNVQDDRLKFDLAGVPSGTYTAMIHTDHGVLNKKVIVQQ